MVVNVAYPIGDLMLLALSAAALVLSAPRIGRGTLAGALAAASFVGADCVYVVTSAGGSRTPSGMSRSPPDVPAR